ncbi:LysM peptidoglycan-binding domain-containing protein [Paenibacillus sp. MBLB2552]|uniref:LysM peptidoglycan-binding domain-containing protein n=1 Tax=Paenibacillus mellifer TaxID=2937794 RepID=A0A9X1Y7X2_9BACL|nr:LysM peptidoglycan-binding domain-containing protein [Paenibacillus mellifer]MCK8488872.1 LysM peptidoglycan-binding domain-containing protein [Paenibacillus mellifer]
MLADQSYGLRFDIYERIHLSEDVIGIEELEEIELYPKIQVIPGEEYAALRGHLLLSGLYRGEGETRELAHYIPVEITIPLSRVNRLEDITVEIENFDVDLLSSRSLNITGVLSLQGVETSSLLAEQDAWKDREFTTAHVVSAIRGDEPEANLDTDTAELAAFETEEESGPDPIRPEPLLTDEVRQEPVFSWNSLAREDANVEQEPGAELDLELAQEDSEVPHVPQFASWQAFPDDMLNAQKRNADEPQEVPVWTEDVSAFQESNPWTDKESVAYFGASAEAFAEHAEESDANIWFKDEVRPSEEFQATDRASESVEVEAAESGAAFELGEEDAGTPNEALAEAAGEPEAAVEADHQPEEKKEMKIALGAKKGDESGRESFGLTKLISSSSRVIQEALEDASELPIAGSDQGEGEELRWKNLFISNEDQTPFRTVRLVIVQREETLDDIAQRYHLSSRELQLYNRLAEHQVNEGQILYIP